ncbi:hypothetical protein EPO56_03160 [Patescibacteria group bacterium]|nr:MAG: hypothetical protein EPO56_03160 [Patescibacteria group bacterium]
METEEKKETKARSRLYPRYDLEDSIKFIESVSKLGGSRVSNEAVAADLGKAVNNSTFIGRVSSSKQFGILIQESGKLSLSSIGKEIMFPRGDSEKSVAIKSAFSTPALYRELIDTFNGKTIPDQAALGNRLVHDYGIEGAAKDSAARNFIRSAQYAGVLQNGILVASAENVNQEDDGESSESKAGKATGSNPFDDFFKPTKQSGQPAIFNDSGSGWALTIKSAKPLNSATRTKLIELSELLEKVNEENEA